MHSTIKVLFFSEGLSEGWFHVKDICVTHKDPYLCIAGMSSIGPILTTISAYCAP